MREHAGERDGLGKHGHRRHWHGHGGHGGGHGRHRNPFRPGKMLGDGDLRLIVLFFLEKRPRHGYEIIKALEELSSGAYSPSPGIVYPTLTFLEEAGFAASTSEGNRRTYEITDAGRAHLAENRATVEGVIETIAAIGRRVAALSADEAGPRGRGRRDRDMEGVIPELNEARRALKHAMAGARDAGAAEQKRVAGVLRKAAAEIRGAEADPTDDIDLG